MLWISSVIALTYSSSQTLEIHTFLISKVFSKWVGFLVFFSCATFKCIQKASSDFPLSTAEKHTLWQRYCHLSKTCDSYFLDIESLSKVVLGFFSCATFKCTQRASSDFPLFTAEKHILWQRNCLFKGMEERNILISSSDGKSVEITGRNTETMISIVPFGLITWLMF